MTALTDQQMDASQHFMTVSERLPRILSFADEAVEILCLLEEGEGDESELVARFEEVAALLVQKVDRAAWTVRDLERLAAIRKEEADKLRDQAKRIDAAADRLKSLILTAMQTTGQTRVETPRYTVRIQKNPARVEILEEQMVPARFKEVRTEVHIDKRGILAAITKDGEVVPGVEVVRGERLVIG